MVCLEFSRFGKDPKVSFLFAGIPKSLLLTGIVCDFGELENDLVDYIVKRIIIFKLFKFIKDEFF